MQIQRSLSQQVFREGQVAEQGTHDELIDLDGEYAKLVRIQMAHAEDPEETKKREEARKYEQQVCDGEKPACLVF